MARRAQEELPTFPGKKKKRFCDKCRFQEEVFPLLEDTSLQQGRCGAMPSPSGVSQQEQVGSPAEVLNGFMYSEFSVEPCSWKTKLCP